MKHILPYIAAGCSAILLIAAGCTSVEPPKRPVAYVFPTIRTFESLEKLKPQKISTAKLRSWLELIGNEKELTQGGLLEEDLELVSLGLERSGYAELDARKTALSMRWIAFCSQPDRYLEILVGYDKRPPLDVCEDMPPVKMLTTEIRNHFNVPNYWLWSLGHKRAHDGIIIDLATFCQDGTIKPSFWLRRILIPIDYF